MTTEELIKNLREKIEHLKKDKDDLESSGMNFNHTIDEKINEYQMIIDHLEKQDKEIDIAKKTKSFYELLSKERYPSAYTILAQLKSLFEEELSSSSYGYDHHFKNCIAISYAIELIESQIIDRED